MSDQFIKAVVKMGIGFMFLWLAMSFMFAVNLLSLEIVDKTHYGFVDWTLFWVVPVALSYLFGTFIVDLYESSTSPRKVTEE